MAPGSIDLSAMLAEEGQRQGQGRGSALQLARQPVRWFPHLSMEDPPRDWAPLWRGDMTALSLVMWRASPL